MVKPNNLCYNYTGAVFLSVSTKQKKKNATKPPMFNVDTTPVFYFDCRLHNLMHTHII